MENKDKKNNIDTKEKNIVDPVIAGAAGVAVGALGAAAIAMTDKTIRDHTKKKLDEFKDKAVDMANEMKDAADDEVEETKKEVKSKIK